MSLQQSAEKVPKKRPQPKGGSRKGIPNKVTANIKEMIEGALSDVGGRAYLAQQAKENPSAFLTLIGKILPKDINATIDGNINIKQIEIVVVDPKA